MVDPKPSVNTKNNGSKQNKQRRKNNNNNKTGRIPRMRSGLGMSNYGTKYLKTVLAPCSGNARIPDFNCQPTALVTLTTEVILGVSASGVGGCYFPLDTIVGYMTENTTTTTDGAITYNAIINLPGAAAWNASYSCSRVVSACLDIEFLGTTQSDSGIIMGASLTSFNGSLEQLPATSTAVLGSRVSSSNRFSKGMSVVYRPSDAHSTEFRANGYSVDRFGGLLVHISAAASTAYYKAKFTVNYESIPLTDAMVSVLPAGSLTPSPIDPIAHAKATNAMSGVPQIHTFDKAIEITDKVKSFSDSASSIYDIIHAFLVV